MNESNVPLLNFFETTDDVILKILAWINFAICSLAIIGEIFKNSYFCPQLLNHYFSATRKIFRRLKLYSPNAVQLDSIVRVNWAIHIKTFLDWGIWNQFSYCSCDFYEFIFTANCLALHFLCRLRRHEGSFKATHYVFFCLTGFDLLRGCTGFEFYLLYFYYEGKNGVEDNGLEVTLSISNHMQVGKSRECVLKFITN